MSKPSTGESEEQGKAWMSKKLIEATAPNMGVSRYRALELNLAAEARQRLERAWSEENRPAITVYNEHIASNGVFSDWLRSF